MADRHAFGLRVVLVDEFGHAARAPGLAGWLCRAAPARARGLVAIALVGDDVMRRMNRRYLGKNRPTDVLSFPSAVPARAQQDRMGRMVSTSVAQRVGRRAEARQGEGGNPARRRVLGDIAIATGVARRQARQAGHPYALELRVLALHGLLHLLGYDHEADQGRMARLEARLRRRGGLAAGVIERTDRA